MLDPTQSSELNAEIFEIITEFFGEEVPYIVVLPNAQAMLGNSPDPTMIAANLSGALFSLLSGQYDRRIVNAEGEEVNTN